MPSLRSTIATVAIAAGCLLTAEPASAIPGPPTGCAVIALPGAPCVAVMGSDDHDLVPARQGDLVAYTFALQNYGDTDGVFSDATLHLDDGLVLLRASVKINGRPVSVAGQAGELPRLAGPITVPANRTIYITFTGRVQWPDADRPVPLVAHLEVPGAEAGSGATVWPPTTDLALVNAGSPVVVANPGAGGLLDLVIANRGMSAHGATLSIPVPTGWRIAAVAASGRLGVSCAAGTVERCTIDTVPYASQRELRFLVTPGASVPAGVGVALTAGVVPTDASDQFPSDNAVTLQATNRGRATLDVTVSQSSATVLPHGLTRFTVSVTNRGPDAGVAPRIALLVRTDTVNGFTQLRPAGPGGISLAAGGYQWQPGTVPAGRTVRLIVTWRGEVLGATGRLETRTWEEPYNAAAHGAPYETVSSGQVRVVAPPPAVGGESAAGAAAPGLAATGAVTAAGLSWGAGLVLFGGLLTALGRRRRPGRS